MKECKKKENGFYMGEDLRNPLAEITYHHRDQRTIIIDHTYVSDVLRGQGLGGSLVREVAELARRENKKIVPLCSFAQRIMIQNPDYQDVLAE